MCLQFIILKHFSYNKPKLAITSIFLSDLPVYFLGHSGNKIGLPLEIQLKINSLITESNRSLITEQTKKEEEELEILYVLIFLWFIVTF